MMNNFSVIGRWTKEPELRYTPSGKPVVTGTLAVQRSFKNAQGEYDADFIPVVIWGKVAETVANRCEKGGRFGGTGRIQTRNYENNEGKRVYITEVIIENVTMIDWSGSNNGQGGQSGQSGQGGQGGQSRQTNQNQSAPSNDPFSNNGQPIEISDDDLPF